MSNRMATFILSMCLVGAPILSLHGAAQAEQPFNRNLGIQGLDQPRAPPAPPVQNETAPFVGDHTVPVPPGMDSSDAVPPGSNDPQDAGPVTGGLDPVSPGVNPLDPVTQTIDPVPPGRRPLDPETGEPLTWGGVANGGQPGRLNPPNPLPAFSGQQPPSPPTPDANQAEATPGHMMIGNVCNDEMWFSFGSDGRTGEELARIAKERGVTFEQASRAAFENRVRRAKEIAKDGHAVEVCTRDGGWFLRVGRLN